MSACCCELQTSAPGFESREHAAARTARGTDEVAAMIVMAQCACARGTGGAATLRISSTSGVATTKAIIMARKASA